MPSFFRCHLLLMFLLLPTGPAGASVGDDPVWISNAPEGRQVHLYFFWSRTCPHCQEALPFVQNMEVQLPWLELHSAEVTTHKVNAVRYSEMAAALGEEAHMVPGFFICGRFLEGYDDAAGRGQELLELAHDCYTGKVQANAVEPRIHLPLLGETSADSLSLPLFTIVVAGLDAFNPCAFFVLLFLLSLMVHTRNRRRMLLLGSVYVLCSGLVYFLFMGAWLNLFMVIGATPWITGAAGILALVIGLLNTKDYFLFHQGPSLAIPGSGKTGLFRRMRGLLNADRLPVMLAGTVVLALAANSYELVCTAGFPMVYTRVLTLQALPNIQYYAYLALYNLVYILPLMVIVLLFTRSMSSRKLSERQGRTLKLLSGLMMVALGGLLVAAPGLLTRLWVGASLLLGAVLLTWLITQLNPPPGSPRT